MEPCFVNPPHTRGNDIDRPSGTGGAPFDAYTAAYAPIQNYREEVLLQSDGFIGKGTNVVARVAKGPNLLARVFRQHIMVQKEVTIADGCVNTGFGHSNALGVAKALVQGACWTKAAAGHAKITCLFQG
jgi:hypothetical protein